MLPPVVAPRIEQPRMNVPNQNINLQIQGQSQRGGAYLVQGVVAPKINHR